MYTIAWLFACLLCLGNARGIQPVGEESTQEAKQAFKEMLANGPSKELMEHAAELQKAFQEDVKADPNLLEELDAKVAEVREAFRPTKSLAALMLATNPAIFQGRRAKISRNADTLIKAAEGPAPLNDIAKKLNPVVGYWDPLDLGHEEFWDFDNAATIGFLRHSEIKHGRVAMAAFVGYIAQSNGLHFPWKLTGEISFADISAAGSPPEQWDALPIESKYQIILFIGFLEIWSENSDVLAKDGLKHYMRGGEPGKYPSFDAVPHPVPLNLWDPLKTNRGTSDAKRAKLDKSLLAEINNGRLAMLGIISFLAEQKVPGAIPLLGVLDVHLKPYAGQVMDPFGNGPAFSF